MIYEPDRAAWIAAGAQLHGSEFKELQYRVFCKDGSLLWVLSRGQRVTREDGSSIFYCILIDITETKKAQEELRLSLERHQIIMDQTEDIIFEWDIVKDTLLFSPNWHKKFGYTPVTEHIGKYLPGGSHIHPADGRIFLGLMEEIAGGTPYKEAEFRISKANNKYIWCRIRASLQKDSAGRPAKAVGVISDIDAQKQEAQKLQEKAERDALTGLYNKGTAQQQIEQYLHNCSQGGRAAFFIVDVDDFKNVNDMFGHLSGDVMLSDMAGALQNLFRSADVVGRIGGDEFAVLMQGIQSQKDAERKAREILDSFRTLFKREYHVSCSIGIAFAPEDGDSFLELYKKADIALYHAKAKRKE